MKSMPKVRLIRLRGRNQITLPDSVVRALSLEEGDHLAAVVDEDGIVRLRAARIEVAGTPGAARAIEQAEADLKAGRTLEFDSVRELSQAMMAAHDEQMAEQGEPEQTSMLVQVAPTTTSLSVLRDGVPVFTRNVAQGAGNAPAYLIAEEVRQTIEAFGSLVEGEGVRSIFLSAGPPPMPGLLQELQLVVKLPVRELTAVERGEPTLQEPSQVARHPIFGAEDVRINFQDFPEYYKQSE
jgi:bifunctional DNA-binding transcriptional regulator/antitoxin component of YhaV-PrlF toxin-antitoxin module